MTEAGDDIGEFSRDQPKKCPGHYITGFRLYTKKYTVLMDWKSPKKRLSVNWSIKSVGFLPKSQPGFIVNIESLF